MIIITDSAADMPREELDALGIKVAPLLINFPDGQVSAEDISPDEFYKRLEDMQPEIPTTSQPSPGFFTSIYEKFNGIKDEILSIHVSSGLSGTIEAARLGAKQAIGLTIHHIDSLTLSGGQRFQVLAAALAAKAGWGKNEIVERLKTIRESTEVVYTLETLTYLARGGRIGRVQALAGSLLKIKPVIKVDKVDGKYSTVGKERTIGNALSAICNHLLKTYGTETPLRAAVMHGQFAEQAQTLAEMLQAKLRIVKLEILRISPVLGVHTGPGIVGVAAVPLELFQGLD